MRTRATGSLFFLPDDRRVRARAEVKLEPEGAVAKYGPDFETDPQLWIGFHSVSAARYELEL